MVGLTHSHLDGVPRLSELHLGTFTTTSAQHERGQVAEHPLGTTQFVEPPYALQLCLHLSAGVRYYCTTTGEDT